jgi:hypothetical protein
VALELAALEASTPLSPNANAAFVLVVASDADVGAYVSDALRRGIGLDVVAMGSVALALDAAARRRPLVLVVAHTERAVLRHLPGVPAVLLSDEAPTSDATHARFAPLVVLRGAFRAERLLDVVASLLAGGAGSSPTNGQTETHDG